MFPSPAQRKPWWLGIAVAAMGAVWIAGAVRLPLSDRLSGLGAGAFVLIIGGALVLLGLTLLWQVARGATFEPEAAEDVLVDAPVSYAALAMVTVAVLMPALLMPRLGFPLTATLSYTLITRALGARNMALSALIGALLSSAAWYAFTKLGVQLGAFMPGIGA